MLSASPSSSVILWRKALLNRRVWQRACLVGLPVGAVQIVINQGDAWLYGTIGVALILKTILTPVVSVAVCLVSAAGNEIEHQREKLAL